MGYFCGIGWWNLVCTYVYVLVCLLAVEVGVQLVECVLCKWTGCKCICVRYAALGKVYLAGNLFLTKSTNSLYLKLWFFDRDHASLFTGSHEQRSAYRHFFAHGYQYVAAVLSVERTWSGPQVWGLLCLLLLQIPCLGLIFVVTLPSKLSSFYASWKFMCWGNVASVVYKIT